MTDIVHDRPPRGSGLMPCCGRSPAETPGQRQTPNPGLVTCGGSPAADGEVGPTPAGTVDNPDGLRDQVSAAIRARLQQAVVPRVPSWDGQIVVYGAATEYDLADAVLAVPNPELQQLRAQLARVARLADEYPVHIDTALVLEALDQPARDR